MTKLSTYLRSVFFKYKTYLCSLCTIAITASVFKIVKAYNIKEIIDAIQSHNDITTLLMLFVLYTLMHYGTFFISRLLDIKYKPTILAETITDIYTRTLRHSLHWFDSHLSGEVSNKIKDFQDSITTLITHCFQVLVNITTIVISIFFLLSINLALATVILIFITVYTPVIAFLLKKQMKLQEQCVTAGQATLGIINDSIANILGVKIIGNMWTEFKLKVTPALLHWQDSDKRVRKFDAYWVDSADTIMATIMYAVQIYLLAYLHQNGHITAGDFVFVSMITLGMHGEIDAVLTNLLFNINPRIASMKASFSFISRDYDTEDVPNAGSLTNVRGEIRFENVCFAYDQSRIIIHNFNLHICAGQKIGIVGISGAGKTTLIKCLLRYFDVQRGRILIDGHDIAGVTQESLWANLSVIPQDVTMLHRTILENLQLAKHDASFNEIIEACKKAKIHDNIMQMTNGYHSIVGERGIKVSGGQRQRIAIARAILKDAPILILDEATSALDTPTEQLVQESLNEVLETSNATAIVIAHRLSTLLHMDRILVFDQGKIVEDGTHQELLSKNGMYKTLWDTQVGGFLPEESGGICIKECIEEQT